MTLDGDTRQEQIQRYLNGNMTIAETNSFEELMKTDEALAAEVALQQDLKTFVQNKKKRTFRDTIKSIGNDFFD